ncbi:4Fe-4S cluster-binding domain-containing protein [Olsenella massiliensis]|uniref:4Fe-4S cluster-binding domain-containing protein n=1 Tax=Olsenella massiliensis TaxID=1622075 RepID=UPI00071C5C2D|nr:4Fe-4S cluster-binding domain-containing protein [Olsenella massiliensis]
MDEGELAGIVTNVQRFSLHDGGGIRTVAFLKGCPFRCPWCCNPENLSFEPEPSWKSRLCIHCAMAPGGNGLIDCPRPASECPTGAKEVVGRERGVRELVDELVRDRTFFDESGGGITLSGGECLAGRNQEFSLAVLEETHRRGVHTAVETTLAVPLADPDRLVAACDLLLVDFKIASPGRSMAVLGLDVGLRDANLRAVLGLGAAVVARLPIVPGFTRGLANARANAERIRGLGISRADVLPFHQLGEAKYASSGRGYAMAGVPQLGGSDVADVVDALEAEGIEAVVHGE